MDGERWLKTREPWTEVHYCPHCRNRTRQTAKARNPYGTWLWFVCTRCEKGRPVER